VKLNPQSDAGMSKSCARVAREREPETPSDERDDVVSRNVMGFERNSSAGARDAIGRQFVERESSRVAAEFPHEDVAAQQRMRLGKRSMTLSRSR
jgi:hypothetical protein